MRRGAPGTSERYPALVLVSTIPASGPCHHHLHCHRMPRRPLQCTALPAHHAVILTGDPVSEEGLQIKRERAADPARGMRDSGIPLSQPGMVGSPKLWFLGRGTMKRSATHRRMCESAVSISAQS